MPSDPSLLAALPGCAEFDGPARGREAEPVLLDSLHFGDPAARQRDGAAPRLQDHEPNAGITLREEQAHG
ncbi:MAG: hypothetical protein M5U26_30515 [Planctomycetota bacterium]|nr:hypothetical protein [Planctomycetota bacterium]